MNKILINEKFTNLIIQSNQKIFEIKFQYLLLIH